MLLATLGINGPLHDALTAPESPRHVGMEHVDLLQTAIEELEARDAQAGGDTLCDVAASLHERAISWLQDSSYTPEVGDALQAVVGELGAWLGWMSFDADRHDRARRAWQDTLLIARMTDDHPLEVQVLVYMCLQSLRQGRPREALQIARTAERIAEGWATPRLHALIKLRIGLAHAATGNEPGLGRALSAAQHWFSQGPRADDPLFINFVTTQELTGIAATSYVDLAKTDATSHRHRRRLEKACGLYQDVIDSPDPVWRRNSAFYAARLADARFRMGDVAGASEVGLSTLPKAAALNSRRVRRALSDLRNRLDSHAGRIPRAREYVETHDLTISGAART